MSTITLTSPNIALGAGTPSRAMTLTLSASVGSNTTFSMSDASAGGVFYPSAPVITSGNTAIQFVYIPPIAAAINSTITITATGSGGASGTPSVTLPIGVPTYAAKQTAFTGSNGTALTAVVPTIGSAWDGGLAYLSGGAAKLFGDGTCGATATTSGLQWFYIPNSPTLQTDYDVLATLDLWDMTSTNVQVLLNAASGSSAWNGYNLNYTYTSGNNTAVLEKVVNDIGTALASAILSLTTSGASHTFLISVRSINSTQYLFAIIDGTLLTGTPLANSVFTTGYGGLAIQQTVSTTPTSTTGERISSFGVSNVDWTLGSITPPSFTLAGVASNNFTLAMAALSGSTVFTPNDNSAGGTFSPTTLTLSSGSLSGTFTYTPPTGVSSVTIGVTNNQSIGNPVSVTVPVYQRTRSFPNSDIYLSPGTWRLPGDGSAWAPDGGAYLKGIVSNTTRIGLYVDPSINSSLSSQLDYPSVKGVVGITVAGTTATTDGRTTASPPGSEGITQFPISSVPVVIWIETGLSTGTTYPYWLGMIGANYGDGNNWTGTLANTKVLGLVFDTGATLSAPTVRPKTLIVYGASYETSNYDTGGAGGAIEYYQNIDPFLSWVFAAAYALNAEVGIVGISGTGFLRGAYNYPGFATGSTSWLDHYDSTHARSLPNADYVVVHLGENDGSSYGYTNTEVQAAVTLAAQNLRAAYPNAKILLQIPWGGASADARRATAIAAGVVGAADPMTKANDPGTELATAIPFGSSPTWITGAGVHVLQSYHGWLAASVVQGMASNFNIPTNVFASLFLTAVFDERRDGSTPGCRSRDAPRKPPFRLVD